MLTNNEVTQLRLESYLGEILADSTNLIQTRHYWNKNHPNARPLDISFPWNRRTAALQLLAKIALGEELRGEDVEGIQTMISNFRTEREIFGN